MPRITRKFNRLLSSIAIDEADTSTSLQVWHLTMDALLPPPIPKNPRGRKPSAKARRKPVPPSFLLMSENVTYTTKMPKAGRQKPAETVSLSRYETPILNALLNQSSSQEQTGRRRRKQDNPRRSADGIEAGSELDLKEELLTSRRGKSLIII